MCEGYGNHSVCVCVCVPVCVSVTTLTGHGQSLLTAIVHAVTHMTTVLSMVLHPCRVRILLYNDSSVQLGVGK